MKTKPVKSAIKPKITHNGASLPKPKLGVNHSSTHQKRANVITRTGRR